MSRGQAKVLSASQHRAILAVLDTTRDRAMYLLSSKAGLRAVEIAGLRWGHVRGDVLELTADVTKGKKPRQVPIGKAVREALDAYRAEFDVAVDATHLFPNRQMKGYPVSPNGVAQWFKRLYARMGWEGYSSHSGRRTAITQLARTITQHGGSLRDVQQIAGHKDLSTTQIYIEGSSDAKRKAMEAL